MKCPKCGYNSFEHLDECKKCGQGLADHKAKFNLRGFYSAAQVVAAAIPEPVIEDVSEDIAAEEIPGEESVDFGFDFLDEEEDQVEAAESTLELGDDSKDISIEQPFGVDSETVPADNLDADDSNDDPEDKQEKGPEFAF